MIDCISRRPADRRLPGRHADGHDCFAYGQNPSQLRDRYYEAHDLVMKRLDREGHVRLQRPLQPAALRQHLAAADPAAASADLDPRRRLGRDVALVRRDGLRLLLPVLLRLQGRHRRPWTASGTRWTGSARTAIPTAPASPQLVGVAESRAAGARALHRGRRVFLRPLPARRSALRRARRATRTEATQRAGIESQVKKAATCGSRLDHSGDKTQPRPRHGGHRRQRLRHHRLAGRGGRAARELADDLNVGHLMLLMQFGNMSKDLTQYNTQAVRREGDAEAEDAVLRVGGPLVAEADGAGGSAPRCPAFMPPTSRWPRRVARADRQRERA